MRENDEQIGKAPIAGSVFAPVTVRKKIDEVLFAPVSSFQVSIH
jgi:hypothetical protein